MTPGTESGDQGFVRRLPNAGQRRSAYQERLGISLFIVFIVSAPPLFMGSWGGFCRASWFWPFWWLSDSWEVLFAPHATGYAVATILVLAAAARHTWTMALITFWFAVNAVFCSAFFFWLITWDGKS